MKKLFFLVMLAMSIGFVQAQEKDKVKKTTTVGQKVHNTFSHHKRHKGYKTKHKHNGLTKKHKVNQQTGEVKNKVN